MQILVAIAVLVLCYIVGSIPMGYISVKLATGEDVRTIQSGRTGGTNAMRAAGFGVGLATSLADIAKGVAGVWLARTITPGNTWIEVLAPAVIVFGHNYSIFTLRRDENNHLSIGGGAGGAPSVGGAVGYWWPSFFILVPVGALILFGIGYASVATLSLPLIAAVIFAIRSAMGLSPWYYLIYCLLAELLVLWSLRPNLKRLIAGNERLVGWRARRVKTSKNRPETE